jgi:V8-like Glu-specific endopeptidase
MKRHALMLMTLLISSPLFGCSASAEPDDAELADESIVGGTTDTTHPNVVYVGGIADNSGNDWCTGVLIGTKTVLTAAHCLFDYNDKPISRAYVRFSWGGKALWGKATRNPQYSGNAENDTGIILLDQAVSNQKPSPFATKQANAGDTIKVVGYGQTAENSPMSKVRKIATAKITSVDSGKLIFTNPPKSTGYTCWGDSGAPDFMTRNGVDVVVGIDSTGLCNPGKAIWDPQVSASKNFILSASGGNAQPER